MKFLSFDVGIRNLAFCHADFNEETKVLEILEWDIINLFEDEIDAQQKCSHISKMRPYRPCPKFAIEKTVNNLEYFCKAHKKNYKHVKPVISKLAEVCQCDNEECTKKARYLLDDKKVCPSHKVIIEKHFKTNYATKKIKTFKCTDIPIGVIRDKMIEVLDEKYARLLDCDYILIELQPALTAPKMGSVATILSTFYAIRGKRDCNVSDVSFFKATNKLEYDDSNTAQNKSTYSDRKKTGIRNVIDYLDSIGDEVNKEMFLGHKKKDDLADALLQVLIYTKNL